jgi:pimeloyl-[acyl-carrier protein] methyl ester esterase
VEGWRQIATEIHRDYGSCRRSTVLRRVPCSSAAPPSRLRQTLPQEALIAGFIALGDTQIILLPGLDGTGKLFRWFIAAAPRHLSLTSIALPSGPLNYDDLADSVAHNLPAGEPLVVITESFSGPLALALAQRRPIAALVYCNSFVIAPRSRAIRWFVLPGLFGLPLPRLLLRRYMLGQAADDALVDDVAEVVASVPASLLTSRLRMVLNTDEADAFARCTVPTLYVRGTEDRLVPDSAWRGMAAVRPMSIAQVSGPHLLLQANPVGAWNAISPFLKSSLAV